MMINNGKWKGPPVHIEALVKVKFISVVFDGSKSNSTDLA